MIPDQTESPLDRIYDHWLRVGVDGQVVACSSFLRKRLAAVGIGRSGWELRELFDLGQAEGDRFYFAWMACLRGRFGTFSLKLVGSHSLAQISLLPQFDLEGSVTSVMVVIIEQDPAQAAVAIEGAAGGGIEVGQGREQQLRALGKALEEAREQLVAMESEGRARSAFLGSLSRELCTPLNAVIGFCDLLRESGLSEDQAGYVLTIQKSGRYLIELLGQALEYARLEGGELPPVRDRFRLAGILNEIQALYGGEGRKGSVRLVVERSGLADEYLVGDEARLKQVFAMLLGNAFRRTSEGSVVLRVETDRDSQSGEVLLRGRVEDAGGGIEADEVKGLFRPFGDADSADREDFGGSDLGLALCKRLCQSMGGEVWLEKTVLGKGSVFAFEVRLQSEGNRMIASLSNKTENTKVSESAATETAEKRQEQEKPRRGPARLLVVDDNPNNLLISSKLSEHLGYEATTVNNGVDALELMRNRIFDIVLMDIRMAPINGIEATRKIREGEAGSQNSDAYIIAVTAHALHGDKEKCLASGMNDYLSKPLTLDRLKDSLNRARSKRSLD